MFRAEKYRQYAADCLHVARSLGTLQDRTVLVEMAAAWLRLAERTCPAPNVNAKEHSEP
jgi:hypothetical protein